ncbi:MAG: hypothetical protein ABWY78_04255 [Microvirga sp.]
MLTSLPRIAAGTLGLGVSAFLIAHAVLVPPPTEGGYETHVEQFGAMLLAGIALGLAVPVTARRQFIPTMLAIGAALVLLEMFAPEFDGWIARLVLDWFGVSAGLLIIKGLYRSWSAMYDKHLVPWGGAEAADATDEDYDLPPTR